jgi:hypothetical protein
MAYDAKRDENLVLIEIPELFRLNTTRLALRRGVYLRSYVYAFIHKLVPELSEEKIGEFLRNTQAAQGDFVI